MNMPWRKSCSTKRIGQLSDCGTRKVPQKSEKVHSIDTFDFEITKKTVWTTNIRLKQSGNGLLPAQNTITFEISFMEGSTALSLPLLWSLE